MKKMIFMLVVMVGYSNGFAQQSNGNLGEIREYVRTHQTVKKAQTLTEECLSYQWKMQNETGVNLRAAKTLYKATRCDEPLSQLLANPHEVACDDEASCE